MILFLDNAESILDPQGANAREIYAVVEELSQFDNICFCITSRISTVPPDCKCLDIPTLSMDAARDTFYRIYDNDEPSDLVNSILERLDFHPLSIALLATVAHHNKWDTDRLSKEWKSRRTEMLHTRHDTSLATTIELSLASPMFQELGPDARGLLGVVAFFPQGIDENNLEWLFPTISDRTKVFDTLCVLSLTYRSNGFIVMLAPLRDHLCPKDPSSFPLLRTTKDCYFTRLSIDVNPGNPGFEEARWVVSEDVYIEHLLDVFTSTDADSVDVWDTCARFMTHLYWHKNRLVKLTPKIEELPDNHPSKPECLHRLSHLFNSVGNYAEHKRLLVRTLGLWRDQGNDYKVAEMLRFLSDANGQLGLHKEGIERVKEALEIYERLDCVLEQAHSWRALARLLYGDEQLDAAEEAALRVIELLDKDDQFPVCLSYRLLGDICHSRGETEKAIEYFETALGIASSFNWQDQLFGNHYALANLFFTGNRIGDSHVHLEHAKSHAVNRPHQLGWALELQAKVWCAEGRFEEARSEALRAIGVYEKIGAMKDVEDCRALLWDIEEATDNPAASHEPHSTGELPEIVQLHGPLTIHT